MPIFLIPIAAGAYMYYEKRKRDLEEQQNSGESCHETTTTYDGAIIPEAVVIK
jgi:hypothetical protein